VLPADLVVLAVGLVADDALYTACVQARVAAELCHIGDAFSPARILRRPALAMPLAGNYRPCEEDARCVEDSP